MSIMRVSRGGNQRPSYSQKTKGAVDEPIQVLDCDP
jgi:hypothetical protein